MFYQKQCVKMIYTFLNNLSPNILIIAEQVSVSTGILDHSHFALSSKCLMLEGLLAITLIFSSLHRFSQIQISTLIGPFKNINIYSQKKKKKKKKKMLARGMNN
ncbi:hypothetical protein AMECASPLE_017530 [Ameca splendens]|uniref:Uncharacterized protein n=1 Tax=Ameca splendens TaxID=208324 RepID=A0ABV0YDK2_9TELE